MQYMSLLSSVIDDSFLDQQNSSFSSIIINDDKKHQIEDILNAKLRFRSKTLYYLVKWREYDDPTWEKTKNINELQVIERFHELYSDKSGPLLKNLE